MIEAIEKGLEKVIRSLVQQKAKVKSTQEIRLKSLKKFIIKIKH